MKNLLFLVLFLLVFTPFSKGQKRQAYPVDEIPSGLAEKSVAVVRDYEETFEIYSVNRATRRIKYAISILSKPGEDFGVFHEFYDGNMKLGSVQAVIYDSEGKVYEKVKPSDIKDYSATSSGSIYEDSRQKYYRPQVRDFPYTVEYEFEFSYDGLFNMPYWAPVQGFDLGVEKSVFRLITPPFFGVKYLEKNLDSGVQISEEPKQIVYEWRVTNLLPVESEEYSPRPDEFMPWVYTAPVEFEISGYSGNMSDWKSFGFWQLQLLEGRDIVPEETVMKILNLVSNIDSDRERVKAVYKYVQEKTRYVSIQEGIGGWQPMSAAEVDKNGYGDCKALSNYTMALLKVIGIKSHYTKVRAARYPVDIMEEFVSNQSNHVFLCVPVEGDTIWLECTSQTSPFGYIGNFTDNRKVLLVTEEGGKIVRSEKYGQEENLQLTTAVVRMNADNSCHVEATTLCKGLQFDNISGRLNSSYEENERWLYNNIDLLDFHIENFKFSSEPDKPVAEAYQELTVNNYSTRTGKRCFVQLNLLNRISYLPRKLADRRLDVVLRYPYIDIDTIRFIIPDGYVIESVPADTEVITEFGEYRASVSVDNSEIVYIREMKMNEGIFAAELYNSLRQFYSEISRADRAKVVLVESEGRPSN